MKTFYSAQEIEDLARQGVRELMVDDNVVLTDLACQTAELLGVRLVTPGAPGQQAASPSRPPAGSALRPAQPIAPAQPIRDAASNAAPLPAKPKGCQHGPHGDRPATEASRSGAGNAAVMDDLVNAVRQLSKNRA